MKIRSSEFFSFMVQDFGEKVKKSLRPPPLIVKFFERFLTFDRDFFFVLP